VTVLLTRDSDVALSNEARSAVANNNQADLFLSVHIGYSPDKRDSGSSIYVIKEAGQTSPCRQTGCFCHGTWATMRTVMSAEALPVLSRRNYTRLAGLEISHTFRPIAVLASTTMPAIAFEIGNLNNAANSQIMDGAFQGRIVSTIVAAVERFAAARRSGA